MKLLAVAPTGELSGAERVLLRYLRAAAAAGEDVRCLVPAGRFADTLRAEGITTLALPPLDVPPGARVVGLARLARSWAAAARVIRIAATDADGIPVVGVNAMLTSWKGQDVLLDAVARLDVPVQVELMGGRFPRDDAFVEALQRRAAQSDLVGRVTFVGHVADPLARMRTWTVAVSSSVGPEAAPLNVLEAMSIGLPMVATGHGGTPEVLGGAGLLVPPGDPAAMAAALRRLLTEPDLYARCAATGPVDVVDGLRLEDAADGFLRALSALAPRPSTVRPETVPTEETVS